MKFHIYTYIDMIAPILLWYIAIVDLCLSLLTLLIIGDIHHCYIPNTYYMVIVIIILICRVFILDIT